MFKKTKTIISIAVITYISMLLSTSAQAAICLENNYNSRNPIKVTISDIGGEHKTEHAVPFQGAIKLSNEEASFLITRGVTFVIRTTGFGSTILSPYFALDESLATIVRERASHPGEDATIVIETSGALSKWVTRVNWGVNPLCAAQRPIYTRPAPRN